MIRKFMLYWINLDKRVYEVGYIKYINTTSLRGKYTVYFKVGNKLYKTNSYVEG